MTGNTALNIGALFTEVFGISSPIYLPWGRTLQDYDPGKYIGVTTIPDAEAEAYSWMGTPVIGTFTLDGNKQYSTYNPDGSRGSMNCSKTKVLGVHGTVKEVYGLDDWKINIRGFCIADKSREGYKTVAEQVNALCKFRKVTEAVGVTGSIFNNKEIYSIVIDNISFNPIQGNSSVVPFTIEATSDNPYELTL